MLPRFLRRFVFPLASLLPPLAGCSELVALGSECPVGDKVCAALRNDGGVSVPDVNQPSALRDAGVGARSDGAVRDARAARPSDDGGLTTPTTLARLEVGNGAFSLVTGKPGDVTAVSLRHDHRHPTLVHLSADRGRAQRHHRGARREHGHAGQRRDRARRRRPRAQRHRCQRPHRHLRQHSTSGHAGRSAPAPGLARAAAPGPALRRRHRRADGQHRRTAVAAAPRRQRGRLVRGRDGPDHAGRDGSDHPHRLAHRLPAVHGAGRVHPPGIVGEVQSRHRRPAVPRQPAQRHQQRLPRASELREQWPRALATLCRPAGL